MQEKIYIMGHKNPDSDSICSALAYAEYKNSIGQEAVPVRLGEISRETEFILNYFGVEKPILKETVRLSIGDIDYDRIAPISPDISIKMALSIMETTGLNSIPVVDDSKKLIGMISASDIIKKYIDVWDNTILAKSGATLDNILDTLSAEPIYTSNERPLRGKTIVIAMDPKDARGFIDEEDIAICGSREDAQLLGLECGVSLLIITGGICPSEKVIERAKEKNISLIVSPHDTFTAAKLITQAIPVGYTMTKKDLVYFNEDEILDDVREEMSKTRYRTYPVVNNDKEVIGLISRYHLISSKKKNVILVDHNERSQSIDGLEEAEILEIIDHHRVANVFTGKPIYFRNEPVGSTATIISSIFFENGRRPSREIAGILAGAIISDTLLLRSPTATVKDKLILDRLAKIANIDLEDFANEMFKAGTSLEGKTPKEIINQDFKEFTIQEKKIAISQVFTMDLESLENTKNELLIEMESLRDKRGYNSLVLLLTDIFNESSEIIVVGNDKEKIASAFGSKIKNNTFNAPGVVSRKKQVVPPITAALKLEE